MAVAGEMIVSAAIAVSFCVEIAVFDIYANGKADIRAGWKLFAGSVGGGGAAEAKDGRV